MRWWLIRIEAAHGLPRHFVIGMRGQSRIVDLLNPWMRFEELGDPLGVGDVPLHAQGQRRLVSTVNPFQR